MKGASGSLWIGAAAAALAAGGCGGGQGGGGATSTQAHTSKNGDATVNYFGTPKPQVTSASGPVTVVGQAGAIFSSVTLEPPPNLADTYIVYPRAAGDLFELYTLPYATLNQQLLYQDPGGVIFPGISAYGTIAFYNGLTDSLATVRSDGSGLKALSFSGAGFEGWPQYAVDGTNRISFAGTNGLYVGPGTGGTPTLIQSGALYQDCPCVWSTNGTQIAYSPNGATLDTYVTPSGGGTPTDVTPSPFHAAGSFVPMAWSADGISMLAAFTPSADGDSQIVKFDPANPSFYESLTPSGNSDTGACYSPDGSKILIYRTALGGATPGIYIADATGANQTLLMGDPPGGASFVGSGLQWSPFLPKEAVVSASGSTFYHQAASGFLLGSIGSQFGSMVAFSATTPASAAIQAPASAGGGGQLAFVLTADSITSIGYANNYFSPGTIVSLTSTPSAVVTIDGITGQVDLVAPAAQVKPATVLNADGTITYKATFKALYDGKGANLAPQGASQVTVDPKTGKMVRFG